MLEEVESKDPGGLWEAMGRIAKEDYWFYMRVVLNYRWMEPFYHGEEIFRFLEYLDNEDKDGLLLIFRGGGKSGVITAPMPSWTLAKNPELLTMLCNYSESKAHKFARTSANIMTKNKLYKLCFPDVVPTNKWGDDGYFLNSVKEDSLTTTERLDPNLIGYGTQGNVTGSHVNGLVILDDLISKKIARSPGELQKVEEFFAEVINTIDPGVPLRMCMTRWHYNDFLGKVESGELAGRNGPIEVLKIGATRKRQKTNGQVVEELTWPRQSWFDDSGNEHEVGVSFENLEAFKKNLKGLFSALYYNEPVLDEDCVFAIDLLKRYRGLKHLPFQTGPVYRVALETEAQAVSLVDTCREMMRNEGKRMPLEKVSTKKQNKEQRIMDLLQTPIAEGKFNMLEDTYQRAGSLFEEMKHFPKGHDDQLDAHAYAYEMCKNSPKDDEFPPVCIACDPAYTEGADSDYTAIAAGCIYEGEYYELYTHKFKTNRSNVVARMLFNVFDKFDKLAFKRDDIAKKKRMSGFSSYRASKRGRTRRGRKGQESFEVDMSQLVINSNEA